MTPKHAHNLVQIPLFIIALGAMGLGVSWMWASEPWLLDQQANESLLGVDFHTLLQAPINEHLPDYFRLSYRFFGWWLFSVGMLIGVYVQVTRMGTALARKALYGVLFIILAGVYGIEMVYLPGSPFLYLTHGLLLLLLISIYGAYQLGSRKS